MSVWLGKRLGVGVVCVEDRSGMDPGVRLGVRLRMGSGLGRR